MVFTGNRMIFGCSFASGMMASQQRLYSFLDLIEKKRPGSRQLAAHELVKHEGSYAIYFPSPVNRRKLSFWIWIDDCNETSITFADWHTHGSVASAFSSDTPTNPFSQSLLGFWILDSFLRSTRMAHMLVSQPLCGSTIPLLSRRCSQRLGLLVE